SPAIEPFVAVIWPPATTPTGWRAVPFTLMLVTTTFPPAAKGPPALTTPDTLSRTNRLYGAGCVGRVVSEATVPQTLDGRRALVGVAATAGPPQAPEPASAAGATGTKEAETSSRWTAALKSIVTGLLGSAR